MPNALRLTFAPDLGGSGELSAEARVGKFSGVGSAWFTAEALLAFAGSLESTYPISEDAPLHLKGGYWTQSGDAVEELHLGLFVFALGSRGRAGCRVQLATPHEPNSPSEGKSSLDVVLVTSYQQLREFSHALIALVEGGVSEAVLEENAG